jgi:hypothetical protein
MIRLKETQEITASQIDSVVAALNTNKLREPELVLSGMKAIHSAIASLIRSNNSLAQK